MPFMLYNQEMSEIMHVSSRVHNLNHYVSAQDLILQ